ncbi:LuxR C-terminal-related transcriptional regulator [Streptomyces sp. NPDC058246]|uniref:LuxR C-terminal-related transcriptional regulator n=1 Tax=unclassified Streptomyces TaxID=2593676 RepID=UPI00365AE858
MRNRVVVLPFAGTGQHRTDPANAHALAVVALVETGRAQEATRLTDSFDLRDAHDLIAGLLQLARRTVETHLTGAYRKLGIRRRAELAAVIHEPNAVN